MHVFCDSKYTKPTGDGSPATTERLVSPSVAHRSRQAGELKVRRLFVEQFDLQSFFKTVAEASVGGWQNADISLEEAVLDPELHDVEEAWAHDHDQQQLGERIAVQGAEEQVAKRAQRIGTCDQNGDDDGLGENDDQQPRDQLIRPDPAPWLSDHHT